MIIFQLRPCSRGALGHETCLFDYITHLERSYPGRKVKVKVSNSPDAIECHSSRCNAVYEANHKASSLEQLEKPVKRSGLFDSEVKDYNAEDFAEGDNDGD